MVEFKLKSSSSHLFYRKTGVNVADNRWHYVCATWDQDTGQVALIVDGKQVSRSLLGAKHKIKSVNGSFIIGQEQDKLGGGFQSTQNFIGELSGMNLWTSVLALSVIQSLTVIPKKADELKMSRGNIMPWSDAFCASILGETQVIDPPTSCKNVDGK